MNLTVFANHAVFHPVGDPSWPQKCERPASGGVDELLPGAFGMMDCILQILHQDSPILHKTLDFFRNMQTGLYMCIHLFPGSDPDISEQSFFEMIFIFVTIAAIYRFAEILSISRSG